MRKTFLAGAILLSTLGTVSSCNNSSTTEQPGTSATADTAASKEQMAYICPMECEGSASMEPGTCPVCKMDLEKNPAYAAVTDSAAVQ
ncbi:heavy metal-binding domain-containing protein [Rufibacter sediminis]|uniref:Heavy metal binding domain-containing protein n=1 Tax=Rufibacter sediminis TaxID=2762756 RepID=A0ABR6VR92_9BACT|nr:heavy metal-binding domain-containing protein [Rufibacter sediminis]MBC3539409.1 hypothetical protein [Rufibacter sediminis]